MKIVLLKDVKGVGRAHEAVEAKDGHALNYLIPQKLAVAATPAARAEAELRFKQVSQRKELDARLLSQNIAVLEGARIVIKVKANEKGHLYDAVGESDIAKAAKEQVQVDLPENAIKLEKPIKELGTFDIPVSAQAGQADGTFGKFSIIIEAE